MKTETKSAGTGVLVAPGYFVTCTHTVVEAQGGGDRDAADMGKTIAFDMPLLPAHPSTGPLRALPVICKPVLDNPLIGDLADVALLRVIAPEQLLAGAEAAVLESVDQSFGRAGIAFGFERLMGDLVRLTLLGIDATGSVQLEQRPGYPEVARGFSGAGVHDLESGAILGMLVRRDMGNKPRKAFMIPANKLLAVLAEAGIDPERTGPGMDAGMETGVTHKPDPEPPNERLLWKETVRLLTDCLTGDAAANSGLCNAAFLKRPNNPVASLRMDGLPGSVATAWTSTLWEAKCVEGRSPLSLLLEAGYSAKRDPAVKGPQDFRALLEALDAPCARGG